MANTRKAAKRAKQALTRQTRNRTIQSATRSAVRTAISAIKGADGEKTKLALHAAVKALSKAASKGSIPKGRAARKISRLAALAKKTLTAPAPAAAKKTAASTAKKAAAATATAKK